MLLAELEVWHSRPIAPTRRVAIGHTRLPTDPAPGFGGILLGGVIAAHIEQLDAELYDDLHRLITQIDHGQRIPQPRLRHRLQTDRIGLTRTTHRLLGEGETIEFAFGAGGSPAQHVLAAVYAAGALPPRPRHVVCTGLHKAMRWRGPIGPSLVAHLSGAGGARLWSPMAFADPEAWALGILGFDDDGEVPVRRDVQSRFRVLIREAHPDHGGLAEGAGRRIQDLTEARRILLG